MLIFPFPVGCWVGIPYLLTAPPLPPTCLVDVGIIAQMFVFVKREKRKNVRIKRGWNLDKGEQMCYNRVYHPPAHDQERMITSKKSQGSAAPQLLENYIK